MKCRGCDNTKEAHEMLPCFENGNSIILCEDCVGKKLDIFKEEQEEQWE